MGGGAINNWMSWLHNLLLLNIVSVFIEFLKKQMQVKRMNSSRCFCRSCISYPWKSTNQQLSQSSMPRTAPSNHANISFIASWE